ncbi:helix-turn-helix domain-containing protein [Micromonospora sp. NBC_01813]|uniref:helix-turn-helix domain-containing protein n=1 Tax=Micromonospora sp. NBC_01813 TaxID=2975988 RepID=UPI002DDBFD98|nr:helix-turn-helix transcriptional regulator [Micromonospora sp. NBC_01813]WSA09293.1 helix-turn-helix domain-containing protein [Micromonospora sp. NBC_01813]
MANSTIKRRRLAATLRKLREQADLTLDEVAERMGLAQSTMSRIETARAAARPAIVRGLLTVYDVRGDEAEAIVQIAKEATKRGWWYSYRDVIPDWFETFVGFEGEASLIQAYQPQVVPGLLQTEDYARAMLGLPWQKLSDEEVDRRVKARLGRQQLLEEERSVSYHVVLSEAALHCQVGSPEVMREQMARLTRAVERRQATVQILPFAAGPLASSYGPFVLLDFPSTEDPPVGYVEHLTGGLLLEDAADIQRYRVAFHHQCAAALPLDRSLRLIEEAAKRKS